MGNKRYIGRIKKLLNLAKSSNSHEAASALNKAQAMMRKYGVELNEVLLAELGSTTTAIPGVRPPQWVTNLALTVASALGASVLLNKNYNKTLRRRQGEFEFVAKTPNDEIASYCFDILYKHLLRDRKRFISELPKRMARSGKTARADWYCMGWVNEIDCKVAALEVSEKEQQLITAWLSANKEDVGKHKQRKARDISGASEAFMRGKIDGAEVELHAGVKGRAQDQVNFTG